MFIFPECGWLPDEHHNVKVQYAHLVRTQGLGIGLRSATDSFVLTHCTSAQATVYIGTNKVCRIVLVCSNWIAVRNWRQRGRASELQAHSSSYIRSTRGLSLLGDYKQNNYVPVRHDVLYSVHCPLRLGHDVLYSVHCPLEWSQVHFTVMTIDSDWTNQPTQPNERAKERTNERTNHPTKPNQTNQPTNQPTKRNERTNQSTNQPNQPNQTN